MLVERGIRRGAPRPRHTAVIAALAALLLAPVVRAERVPVDPGRFPRIVNGVNTHDYPTTGGLLYSFGGPITDDNGTLQCSGTLIGCQTFLVAAHCVVDDPNPGHYRVYLQHAGLVSASSITRHPSYLDNTFPLFDAAVVKLGAPVTGIVPTAINQTDPLPFIPAAGTIVGFGQTQGSGNDYGIKRVGPVHTASCPPDVPSGATDADVVCWSFTGAESNTCNGDSGGPLFLDLGAGPVVAGITSGGSSDNCLATDHSYDANVFTHRSFILGQLGADSTTACGGLAPVGDAQTTVIGHDGTLDPGNSSATYTVDVPAGANALRVTLNGEDNGFFDVNLYVKHGLGAGPSNFDCKADGGSVYGACIVDLPAAGTWSAAVERVPGTGTGQYQLTATILGGSPPVCGNGTREFTEQCDGADAALCPGQCDATCHCPLTCTQDDFIDIKARLDPARFKVRGRLLSSGGGFAGADPRQGFTLTLTQGAAALTIDIPANDPGWAKSKPERGRYKWIGSMNGITRVKAIDRSVKTGAWKIIVIGKAVPGASAIDANQPVDIGLTIDGVCTTTTYP